MTNETDYLSTIRRTIDLGYEGDVLVAVTFKRDGWATVHGFRSKEHLKGKLRFTGPGETVDLVFPCPRGREVSLGHHVKWGIQFVWPDNTPTSSVYFTTPGKREEEQELNTDALVLGDLLAYGSPRTKAMFIKHVGDGSALVLPYHEGLTSQSHAPLVIHRAAIKTIDA